MSSKIQSQPNRAAFDVRSAQDLRSEFSCLISREADRRHTHADCGHGASACIEHRYTESADTDAPLLTVLCIATRADACQFGVAFARAGFDFLSLSTGGKFEDAKRPKVGHAIYPYTGPSGHECMPTVWSDGRGPFGRNLHLARAIRTATLVHGLARTGGRYGLVTMCVGTGMGAAGVFERV